MFARLLHSGCRNLTNSLDYCRSVLTSCGVATRRASKARG